MSDVFVTGGSGYIGSAVVRALVAAGHRVTALVRPSVVAGAGTAKAEGHDKAERLRALGATIVVGAMEDGTTWSAHAERADSILLLAQDRDDAARRTHAAVDTALAAARASHSDRPRLVVYTSGTWVLGDTGDTVAEEDAPTEHAAAIVAWRPGVEEKVLRAAADGAVVTAVVRPGLVYGGHGGMLAGMFADAERARVVTYVGNGQNRWSLVYLQDLAQLYVRIVEQRAPGLFHAVDGAPLRAIDVARAASLAAGAGPVRMWRYADAHARLGAYAEALVLDQVVGSWYARHRVGWKPSRPRFVDGAAAIYQEWKDGSP